MKNIILLAIIASFLFVQPIIEPATAQPEKSQVIEVKQMDKRAIVLKNYLSQYNSPLENHAQDFVDAADKYNVNWKLVPAIAGVESTFGKHIPGGYNGWGWGVYGDQALGFNSWTDGIYTVTRGLREGYLDKGLENPAQMNTVYASSPYWGTHVSYFLADLDKFEKNQVPRFDSESNLNLEAKTAGNSATLTFKI